MNVYFDTEFSGLHKDTSLISIGLISEDGRTFYGEFTDYNEEQIDDWIRDNVICNLRKDTLTTKEIDSLLSGDNKYVYIKRDSEKIKQELLTWLNQFETVEWISDVCHYDFVLLIDLLCGNALNMPKGYAAVCHDINQDIARYYGISNIEAFDKSREDILKEHYIGISGDKHNSLYDAQVIRGIYKVLNKNG